MGVLALLVGAALGGNRVARGPGTIEVKRIVVTDPNGVARAFLGSTPEGDGVLELMDAKGRTRIQLLARDQKGPILTLRGWEGPSRILIGLDPDDTPSINLLEGDHRGGHLFLTVRDGEPTLTLGLDDGQDTVTLMQREDGASLSFSDRGQIHRVGMGISTDGKAGLNVSDRQGRTLIGLGSTPTDAPYLHMGGLEGIGMLKLGLLDPDGSPILRTRSPDGKEEHEFP